eukprot:1158874-Pelagomonas_calceolata.AAC.6
MGKLTEGPPAPAPFLMPPASTVPQCPPPAKFDTAASSDDPRAAKVQEHWSFGACFCQNGCKMASEPHRAPQHANCSPGLEAGDINSCLVCS